MNFSGRTVIIFITILFLLFSCISRPVYFSGSGIEKNKSRIAVLPFKDFDHKQGNNSGTLVRNIFETRLRARGYQMINFEKSYPVVPEVMYKDFHFNSKWIVEKGSSLDADYVLYGHVYDYKVFNTVTSFLYLFSWLETTYSVGITAKLVSCKTGETVWSGAFSSKSYTFNDAARESVDALLRTISKKPVPGKWKK